MCRRPAPPHPFDPLSDESYNAKRCDRRSCPFWSPCRPVLTPGQGRRRPTPRSILHHRKRKSWSSTERSLLWLLLAYLVIGVGFSSRFPSRGRRDGSSKFNCSTRRLQCVAGCACRRNPDAPSPWSERCGALHPRIRLSNSVSSKLYWDIRHRPFSRRSFESPFQSHPAVGPRVSEQRSWRNSGSNAARRTHHRAAGSPLRGGGGDAIRTPSVRRLEALRTERALEAVLVLVHRDG
jgi:hypothetical protein